MRLFELRACWTEYYDCPDNGRTSICDTYETIALAVDDDTRLKEIAADLTKGYGAKIAIMLSSLGRDTEYKIVELTDLLVNKENANV